MFDDHGSSDLLPPGAAIGFAIGIGRRMRAQNAAHSADLAAYQDAIDDAVSQRDRYAAAVIARDHQIMAMWEALSTVLEGLPTDHAMRQPTACLDIRGRPMTRVQAAVGSMTLQRALSDSYIYYDTLSEVAYIVGVRRNQPRAWELRRKLAADGQIETATQLAQALR